MENYKIEQLTDVPNKIIKIGIEKRWDNNRNKV